MNVPKEKLTEKEEETMFLLWEYGPCTVKDLLNHYREPRPHINTVSSFVRTLEAKGYVDHRQGRYGSFQYYAVAPKEDYQRNAIGRLVDRCFGSCFSMVSRLVEDRRINADELRQLLDMVDKKEK